MRLFVVGRVWRSAGEGRGYVIVVLLVIDRCCFSLVRSAVRRYPSHLSPSSARSSASALSTRTYISAHYLLSNQLLSRSRFPFSLSAPTTARASRSAALLRLLTVVEVLRRREPSPLTPTDDRDHAPSCPPPSAPLRDSCRLLCCPRTPLLLCQMRLYHTHVKR